MEIKNRIHSLCDSVKVDLRICYQQLSNMGFNTRFIEKAQEKLDHIKSSIDTIYKEEEK